MIKYFSANIGWVALGGMCGALLRYGTNLLFSLLTENQHFLTATIIENFAGSFLMGILFVILSRRAERNARINLFLLTGLLGSYTTYSSFIVEAHSLLTGSFLLFSAYLFGQLLLGVGLLLIGMRVAENFFPESVNS